MTYDPRRPASPAPRRNGNGWIFAAIAGMVIVLGIAWAVSNYGDSSVTAVPGPNTTGQGAVKTPANSGEPATTPAKPAAPR